jgi:RNA polymerase sigma-70 factor (ECF subfamily)
MTASHADDRPVFQAAAGPNGGARIGAAIPAIATDDAFDRVYRDHVRFVWRCVRRLGVDDSSVEDVVQDAFVVVHRRLGEFEGRSTTRTWLYGIVRRVVADHRRTRRRKPLHLVEHPQEETEVAATGDAHSDAERSEQVALMRRVLARLSDEKREVLVLADFEEMTMSEIAEATDTNPNTVSSRLRAARREFEAALDDEMRVASRVQAAGTRRSRR